ncbi:MAG: diacylglycerol/lipid kinase family protein [Candidatus Geothermincolia bacterium]
MERFTQASFKKGTEGLGELTGRHQTYLVICNPVSRGGKALKEAVWLLKHLSRLGVHHEAFFTDYPGHARNIVKRWLDRVDVVVAVGGDGTVNEVVNGMMDVAGQDKTFAVFPAGTADDFCHNVGIGRDRAFALQVLLTDHNRRMDLIKYNDNYAAVTVGLGVDAEIAYRTLSHKRVRIPAYFAVGVRIVFKERFRNSTRLVRIESDNGVIDGRFLITVFGNAPLFARYVWWMPDAIMDDGLINMSALRPMPPARAWYLLMRCTNRDYRSAKVIKDASSRFSVTLHEETYVQVDGEVYKYNAGDALELSVAPKALKVRVPEETEFSVWSD